MKRERINVWGKDGERENKWERKGWRRERNDWIKMEKVKGNKWGKDEEEKGMIE